MKRRRRSRSVLAVSLFPFLAVLICTLGVLIVLLVLAVKVADTNADVAQAEADAEKSSQLNKVQLQLEERQIQIDGLKQVRPEALERLEDARATRSHFEDELRQLQREKHSLAEALLQLENQRLGIQANKVSDQELEKLRAKIIEAKASLAKKREQAKQVPEVVWSIEPYRGKSGTNRRPIFVECRSDHLVLQPLDIKITQKELRKAIFPGNMLDAALLATREYWQRYDVEGDAGRAYPLIVVRPNGARTFQTVRASLKDWDDEYGYEIVDADKKINFGQYDAELAGEVKAAIAGARRRQNRLAEVATQKRRREQVRRLASRPASERRPGLTVSRTGGGFVFNGVQSASDIGTDSRSRGQQRTAADSQASWDQAANSRGPASQGSDSRDVAKSSSTRVAGGVAGGTQTSGESQPASVAGQADVAREHEDAESSESNSNESLAKKRGANWALPSRSAGAVPYVRPLRVICFADHLVIRGASKDSVVSMDGTTMEAVEELVNEIWTQIESWGIAGQNSYWKPQLRITVMPGSHYRFQELRRLLADSGILVEGA